MASILLGFVDIAIVPESPIVELRCPGFDQILKAWDPGWTRWAPLDRGTVSDDSDLQAPYTYLTSDPLIPPRPASGGLQEWGKTSSVLPPK